MVSRAMCGKTVILAGADITDYQWLGSQIDDGDTIICADSGLRHAAALQRVPDIIVGDFDSVCPEMLVQYRGCSKIVHDLDQNTTDLMKALALSDTSKGVFIYGALGGRSDHDFSNILILMNMQTPDNIVLVSKGETRRVVKNTCVIDGQVDDYVGVFPLARVQDFSVRGLLYTPDILGGPYDFGWNGACNVMIENRAEILFSSGSILVTHTRA